MGNAINFLAVGTGATAAINIPPLAHALWAKGLVVSLAYLVTLLFSGFVVSFFVGQHVREESEASSPSGARFEPSFVIGKCENILTVTFIVVGEVTGLALIFAGKSLVRGKKIESDPGYFLGGTLVNLVWAMLVAMIARVIAFGI